MDLREFEGQDDKKIVIQTQFEWKSFNIQEELVPRSQDS